MKNVAQILENIAFSVSKGANFAIGYNIWYPKKVKIWVPNIIYHFGIKSRNPEKLASPIKAPKFRESWTSKLLKSCKLVNNRIHIPYKHICLDNIKWNQSLTYNGSEADFLCAKRWHISAINSAIWHSENLPFSVMIVAGLKKPKQFNRTRIHLILFSPFCPFTLAWR